MIFSLENKMFNFGLEVWFDVQTRVRGAALFSKCRLFYRQILSIGEVLF